MVDPGLLRLLELVTRELSCADARIEIGGKDPTDPRLVHRPAFASGRVVAVFDAAPADRSSVEARLDALMESFLATAEHSSTSPPPSRTPPDIARRRLDDELTRLADRATARGAVVFDLASPVVWGASRSGDAGVDTLLEDTVARVLEANGELRPGHATRLRVGPSVECFARPFAGVYVIALVFDGVVSEVVAVGALVHAMPMIERLVMALPPVDPIPPGGKLMRLPVRLR
jgi:hypothetical protein